MAAGCLAARVTLTHQPSALRVFKYAAAAATSYSPHLPARHRYPHPPPSLISQPPSVILHTLPPPPHRSRRTSQPAADTHVRLSHSTAHRPPCVSTRCRRRHFTAAAPPGHPPSVFLNTQPLPPLHGRRTSLCCLRHTSARCLPLCISVCLRACAVVSQLTAQYVTKSKSKKRSRFEIDVGGEHRNHWGIQVL